MTFSDKLIALRKKAGWSQEELAERLNVSRQSVSKWESAQSMPDIDKILQLSSLFSVTTDCLLKDGQDDPQSAAAQTPSPLPRVTLTQAEDYLTKAQANAPQMALATALCIVSPIPLLALGTVSELGLLGLDDNLAGGLGMIALLVLVAVAVVLFMRYRHRKDIFMSVRNIRWQSADFALQSDRQKSLEFWETIFWEQDLASIYISTVEQELSYVVRAQP